MPEISNIGIVHWIKIRNDIAIKDGSLVWDARGKEGIRQAEEFYRYQQYSYPKFFKMDGLSKWAWLGAELLTHTNKGIKCYETADKDNISVALATRNGCLAADKKYLLSMSAIPSPALFVYTLSNIMLGEICIRHGFTGEQYCFVQEGFNAAETCFAVTDILKHRDMKACLCGWADATDNSYDVTMLWVELTDKGIPFTDTALIQIHNADKSYL